MIACATALLLAMDVSGSVSARHFEMQRDASADALTSPAVLSAARDGLAVAVVMWGGGQHVVLPWRVITGAADAQEAAAALRGVQRPETGGTNVAAALHAAVATHAAVPCTPERRIIDISGDGRHQGDVADIAAAVQAAAAAEIEVNALPIVTETEPDVGDWYREHVVGPGGGFAIDAAPESFGRAIRMKLALELARATP